MKQILTHKSRNVAEVVEILRASRTFTCPTLPFYRYDNTRAACAKLKRLGLVRVSGSTPIAENLVITPLFEEWMAAVAEGTYNKGVVSWAREAGNDNR